MKQDIDILHHVGWVARDLAATANRFEALGFTLTPATLPRIQLRAGEAPQPIGVANRCVIFGNNYLELLGVVDPTLWGSIPATQRGAFDIDRPLGRYEGLHVLHLGTDDLEAVRRRLDANGIPHLSIKPYERLVDTPDGQALMRARSLSLPSGYMPEALFQIAQHQTPELVLQPRHMRHANGARSLADIIVCVEDGEEVSSRYAAVAGRTVRIEGKVRRIGLGRSDILVTDPAGLRELLPDGPPPTLPFLAGLTISADMALASAFFERIGVRTERLDGHLVVARGDACGSAIRFRKANAP